MKSNEKDHFRGKGQLRASCRVKYKGNESKMAERLKTP